MTRGELIAERIRLEAVYIHARRLTDEWFDTAPLDCWDSLTWVSTLRSRQAREHSFQDQLNIIIRQLEEINGH